MNHYPFRQIDVFASRPLTGNPLAVVLQADGLSDGQMAGFANWTHLSETTFLSAPTVPAADYRVRIFTPNRELPFAGHPTLGSCHAWLEAGGVPKGRDIVQECGAGLVRIRSDGGLLAFAAPPLLRSGAVPDELLDRIASGLRIARGKILASSWVDNGPGWVAVLLSSRAEVLALRPDHAALAGIELGVVARWERSVDGDAAQFEVRAFVTDAGGGEDPVTGSLNAGLAEWLIGTGHAPNSYVARQGTALGREGNVHVRKDGVGIWIGGESITCIAGSVTL